MSRDAEGIGTAARRLDDRVQIRELMARYCRCADLLDADGMADCFTDDCVVGYAPAHGREALAGFLRAFLPATRSSAHYVTNAQIHFATADTAQAAFAMLSWKRLEDHPAVADPLRCGRYECCAVRNATGWRFSRLDLVTTEQSTSACLGGASPHAGEKER